MRQTREVARRMLLAERMNQLPMVAWDRWGGFDEFEEEGSAAASAFGWIARSDGRSDFVVLLLYVREGKDGPEEATLWTNTSSARFSLEIAERLDLAGHKDCRRIEADFAGLVDRVVELDLVGGSIREEA